MTFPPLRNPSIVGFAEAELLTPEVAADLGRRLEGFDTHASVPESVAQDVMPGVLAAIDVANSLHFRFELTEVSRVDEITILRPSGDVSIGGLDGDHLDRKVTLVLTVRGSAAITFPSVGKERRLVAGAISMFPSFLANTVHAPEEDLISIVMYATGPSFR